MSDNPLDGGEHKPRSWLGGWKPMPLPSGLNLVMPLLFFLLGCLLVWIWFVLPVTKVPGEAAIDVFEAALDDAIDQSKSDLNLWYKSNMVIQFGLIFTALFATIFAAITTTENANNLKKWSVMLTAITAGMASMQSTFHVRDNIETFIKSTGDLGLLENDYLAERAPLDSDLKKYSELKKSGAADMDPDLQRKLIELREKFMPRYIAIRQGIMRAWANAGQQSIGSPAGKDASDKK